MSVGNTPERLDVQTIDRLKPLAQLYGTLTPEQLPGFFVEYDVIGRLMAVAQAHEDDTGRISTPGLLFGDHQYMRHHSSEMSGEKITKSEVYGAMIALSGTRRMVIERRTRREDLALNAMRAFKKITRQETQITKEAWHWEFAPTAIKVFGQDELERYSLVVSPDYPKRTLLTASYSNGFETFVYNSKMVPEAQMSNDATAVLRSVQAAAQTCLRKLAPIELNRALEELGYPVVA